MVAMKQIKFRKLRSSAANLGLTHANAPSRSRKWWIAQLAGRVIVNTKITANPRPMAVSTFLEHARKEHMPRK